MNNVDRAMLDQVVSRALAHVAANAAYGKVTLATLNRCRRDIMFAADAYRVWQPPPTTPEPPTLTQQAIAAEHREELASVITLKGRKRHAQ